MSELKVGDVVSFRMDNGNTFVDWRCAKMINQDCVDLFTGSTANLGYEWQFGIHESLIPEGFSIVPIEPTDEMMLHISGESWHESRENYYKLLEAAPKPTDK